MEINIKKNYNGIDLMKFIASILVVCIHTQPLSTYNKYADFLLTQVLARIAVPFFFMASGYFFIKKMNLMDSKKFFLLKKY